MNSSMGRAAHLFIVFMSCLLASCQAQGYNLNIINLAKQSLITASSTCGKNESKYCDPKTLRSARCTEKVCKSACCPTCTDTSPTAQNLANGGSRLLEITSEPGGPGTTQNLFGFDEQKGSYIEVRRLPIVNHKADGFTICVWVNQTTGNEGYVVLTCN